MKLIYFLLIFILSASSLSAKEEEQHSHSGSSNLKINYETLDFSNSKKKENGRRYGVEVDHENAQHHYQLYVEKTDTHTTKRVAKDLEVKKYTLKYQYKISPKKRLSLSYANIDDNLMKETDNGHIYGLGYSQNSFELTQYFSDYSRFDVYQTDLKFSLKNKFKSFGLKTTLIGKYIHLKDKNSNDFSKKAKSNYFTTGVKLHTHVNGYHLGAGVYVGKRVFAVMKEGFKVQHHSMEFKESYMLGVGHSLSDNTVVHLRYGYHKAKELPVDNDNVKVENITFNLVYAF